MAQPVFYHNHPHFEICFYVSGHSRILVAGLDLKLQRGDVLIDDGIHNLEGGDYMKILFSAPHNRNYDAEKNGMIRVRTWDEIVRIIDGMDQPL